MRAAAVAVILGAAAVVVLATLAVTVVVDREFSHGTRTVTVRAAPNPGAERADRGSGCGVERADVKHLTDGFALPRRQTESTVAALVAMRAPPVTQDSPRLPPERAVVDLPRVHVVAVKQEPDSDLHVIVADDTGATMNVEAPSAACVAASPYHERLAAARAALDAALPTPSSSGYTPVDLHAHVRGVRFFDVLHGQRGAPNGVELHPLTFFRVVP